MRVVVQRVDAAEATRDGDVVGRIGPGLLVFAGFGRDDGPEQVAAMARKITNMRIFESETSLFDRSVLETGGDVMTIAQFTLYADTSRGRRPNFSRAATPETARELYAELGRQLHANGIASPVQAPFGTRLAVQAENRGPFTVTLDVGTPPTG